MSELVELEEKLAAIDVELVRLKAENQQLKIKLLTNEQGLKGAIEMLGKSAEYWVIDEECQSDFVVLSKLYVADFLLRLVHIEDQ